MAYAIVIIYHCLCKYHSNIMLRLCLSRSGGVVKLVKEAVLSWHETTEWSLDRQNHPNRQPPPTTKFARQF